MMAKGRVKKVEGWKPSEELTSPNAEEKHDINKGIPSDNDLWGVIEQGATWYW